MYYLDSTMLLLVPGLILGLWAQWRVKNAYEKNAKIHTQLGVPAQEVVRQLLYNQDMPTITIEKVSGTLTDHYDPKTDILRLSQGVYDSTSVSAMGIAAHEAGHALQKKEGYQPLALRTMIVPAVNIGSMLAWPLFFAGVLFSWEPLMTVGIITFGLVVLFSLITLPVEFDASRRAKRMLTDSGLFTESELAGVSEVLSAAAMTYVASFISALMQMLRLILLAQRRRR